MWCNMNDNSLWILLISCSFSLQTITVMLLKLLHIVHIGHEMFGSVTRNYYRGADGIVVLYAVDNKSSFDHCDSWREDFANVVDEEKIAVMLVGCKTDLEEDRQVTLEEAIEKVRSAGWKEMGALCGECSSLTCYNVKSPCTFWWIETTAPRQEIGQNVHGSFDDEGG